MGTRWIAGVFLVALVLAGCGGGDDDSSEASISKQQFMKKADQICKEANKRMEVAFVDFLEKNRDIARPSGPAFEKLVGTIMVPSIKREIEELEALGAPDGDEDEVDEILTALEEGVETAEDNPKVVTGSADTVFGIASRLAEEYGLKVCGSR
jgi:hypothetical protein